MQLEPLVLKDFRVKTFVYLHIKKCRKLMDKLGKTLTMEQCSIARHYNGVRKAL